MSMLRKLLLTIGLILAANVAVLAQGTIKGTVTDQKSGEAMPFTNVVVKQGGNQITGAQTDFDGIYTIKSLPVGKYDIEVSSVGYTKYIRTGVEVKASGFTVVNVQMQATAATLDAVNIEADKVPVIEIGEASTSTRMSSEDIAKMPGTSVESIVAAVGGVGYSDGGVATARGESGMVTMQNGVRKRTGVNVPKEAIAEIQVILGGTPASIGEAIGGTQIITLKPPESQFHGIVKWDSYLDYRLYNMLTVYLTGPMIKKKETLEGGGIKETTFMGFRFAGQGTFYKWGAHRPKGHEYRVVKDEIVRDFESAPIVYDPVSHTTNYAAEYLRDNDFVSIKRPNAKNYYASKDRYANFYNYSAAAQLALAFRFSEWTTMELTGEFTYSKGTGTSIDPLNMTRGANGVSETVSGRVALDFTQRFPDETASANATDPTAKSAKAITNVMWNFTGAYERVNSLSYNANFGRDINNVLKYGHIGQYFTEKNPSYEYDPSYVYGGVQEGAYVQNSWADFVDIDKFIPSEFNPVLANYTLQLRNTEDIKPLLYNFDNILMYKGLINGEAPGNIYKMISNVGLQSSGYSKAENNYYNAQIKAAATVNGKHDIELGFQYDQYSAASYAVSAYSLWSIMRQQANSHISMLDLDNPIYSRDEDGQLYVDFNRSVAGGQTTFDQSMRNYLMSIDNNVNATTWMDVDRYLPDWYVEAAKSLGYDNIMEMFSSDDLFNSGNSVVSYSGYDHTGAKYKGRNWSLDNFYNPASNDAEHQNYRYLPAFSPIYMAGYIQDKFYFEDLIFNVGVRVDYFDGNQYVLKDPYLLYESYTVGDLKGSDVSYNTGIGDGTKFANAAKDDWVVYVDDLNEPTPTIRGYRSGSTWYDKNGVEVSSPNAVSGESGKPTPFRTAAGQNAARNNTVGSEAFKDYDPQIVFMPRVAFSFPVGESSQFKASYDIIARRPSSAWEANYLAYYYMSQISSITNPNLKPERNTNYELGFQQALNKKSAIGISAYYKETRDLIQMVQYAGADPNPNYYSYDNLDFRTTKGFTLTYDLRQTNRVRIAANYTLQYSEGTGLSNTTMSELIKEGYTTLKMLNPISDDRRHEFKANVDYRFGQKDGWHYSVKKKNKETGADEKVDRYPLQNFGINFMAAAQSGRPYTKQFSNMQATIVGSYRGARLPWCFFFDVVADKTWPISHQNKDGKVRNSAVNAAVTINNLFDIRNIYGVFAVTGSPTDDGYLSDPETQPLINAYLDPQSFRDMYSIMLANNYWYYTSPRTIRLTLTYSF